MAHTIPARKGAWKHVFVVHFQTVEPRPVHTMGRSDIERLEFWCSIISEDPVTIANDIKLCEERLVRTFAAHLDDQIRQHQTSTPPGPYRFQLLPPLEYGSLEIKIGVDGAANLLAAFAGNAQLLIDLLTQYSPQAFVASIPIPPLLSKPVRAKLLEAEWISEQSPDGGDKSGRTFKQDELGEKLPAKTDEGEQATETQAKRISEYIRGKTDRALWILANTSLLIPLALSLAVLHIAFRGLEGERERLEIRRQDLEKREAALLGTIVAREAKIFDAFHSNGAASSASAVFGTRKP